METQNRFVNTPGRPTDPDRIEVEHGDKRYPVTVRRSTRAKRMLLRVSSATGDVILTVPEWAQMAGALHFVRAHSGWIASRVARLPERVPFVDGAVVPLRGEPRVVRHVAGGRRTVELSVDPDGVPEIAVGGGPEFVPRRVLEYLRREAERDLVEAVRRHTAAIGIPARKVTIRDTRSRWGSCSSHGSLNFSWRLILAPAFVLDYLAAHEVGHLKEMNHSNRFWRLVKEICPRTAEAERWLDAHGKELHRYGAEAKDED